MMSVRLIIAAVMALFAVSAVAQQNLSSSSSGMDSSSSSAVVISSSTGVDPVPVFFPDNSWQVAYTVGLSTSSIPAALSDALSQDFASTVANSLNMSVLDLLPFVTTMITTPQQLQNAVIAHVATLNVTATSVIFGNLTGNTAGSPQDAANTFNNALAAGTVTQTELQNVDPGAAVPIQTGSVKPAPTRPNGASSVASATMLVVSMIAAVMLML